jgi:hypothetical protein
MAAHRLSATPVDLILGCGPSSGGPGFSRRASTARRRLLFRAASLASNGVANNTEGLCVAVARGASFLIGFFVPQAGQTEPVGWERPRTVFTLEGVKTC